MLFKFVYTNGSFKMFAIDLLRLRYKEFIKEIQNLLTDELKISNPEHYYQLLTIVNKYNSRSPYDQDSDY